MRIVVTGRNGQLATSLSAAAATDPAIEIVPLGRPEFDLARIENLASLLANAEPDAVINAAAYTAVDKAESDQDAALLTNGAAAGALSAACALFDIPIIQISTDYVFDGTKAAPYIEGDQPGPINVYGASKLLGEQLTAAANPRHLIVRTSWVVSPFGQNFVKTMLRLGSERSQLNVVDDQHGAPTYAPHLATALLTMVKAMASASADDPRWGIYHATNAGETTWFGVARETFRHAAKHGLREPAVLPIPTSAYPAPARRPAHSSLDNGRLARSFGIFLPPWQEGVAACVERLLARTPA